jgi:cytoskeletal protein CcmA (bactofilin family)
MTQYVINIGAIPNDGTGDPLRTAFNETNLNFDQVFAAGPVLSNIQIANNKILTTNTNGNLVLAPNGTGVVQSNVSIVPNLANLRNLGSATNRWSTVYTQYLNATQINLTGDLTVTGNLTVQGNIIQIGNIVTDSLTIQLANTASNVSSANGAGITVGVNDNIATILYNSTGNVWTTNIGISSVGNISAPYFIGNGSQLTGLAATYGNANVVTLLAEFGSNNISTTGNVRSNNISTTGNITSNGLVNINSLRVNQTANAWVINGNIITAPSGAFWNSNTIFKDEYINSALDGYINLTSRYANGNTASQIHLEHGLAQIVES